MPASTGTQPASRSGHTAAVYTPVNGQPRVVSCGGVDPSGAYLPAGCTSLDPFRAWAFTPVVGANDTAPRVDGTAVVFNRYMVI